ncbi:MAG: DUF1292 domain-containing protein [Clostridium sp.]|nr:DUF1292 domain-containing protein [Clostridium sp.]
MNDKEKVEGCNCGSDNCGSDHNHEGSCDCGCGCGEHEALTVNLEDENGNSIECEVIDGFEFNDSEFALVQNPEDGSVFLFKVVGEGEEGELVVPDDDEFKAATEYYESKLQEEK